jgi:hypothetical protein
MEKVIPAQSRSLLSQLSRSRARSLGPTGFCLSTAGDSRPAATPPVALASTAQASGTASVAVDRRDGGLLRLRLARDGSYSIVV